MSLRRWFNMVKCSVPMKLHLPALLCHRSCHSRHSDRTLQVPASPSNKTTDVVKRLTWMQFYWSCRAYLVCLSHLPLELPHCMSIRASLCSRWLTGWYLLHGLWTRASWEGPHWVGNSKVNQTVSEFWRLGYPLFYSVPVCDIDSLALVCAPGSLMSGQK